MELSYLKKETYDAPEGVKFHKQVRFRRNKRAVTILACTDPWKRANFTVRVARKKCSGKLFSHLDLRFLPMSFDHFDRIHPTGTLQLDRTGPNPKLYFTAVTAATRSNQILKFGLGLSLASIQLSPFGGTGLGSFGVTRRQRNQLRLLVGPASI